MYKLHSPIFTKEDNKIPKIKHLFKEILGYSDVEIEQFIQEKFMIDIAINLTLEQAQQICEIFYSNEIQLYLYDQQTNTPVFWQKDLGIIIPRHTPKEHYCDIPLISREHLVNPMAYKNEQNKLNLQKVSSTSNQPPTNIPKCPTCQSTNIEKISDVKKAAGFLTVGVFSKNFGKTYHCKNCDYRW